MREIIPILVDLRKEFVQKQIEKNGTYMPSRIPNV
jgi:hypothetical protein